MLMIIKAFFVLLSNSRTEKSNFSLLKCLFLQLRTFYAFVGKIITIILIITST
jgi:hypothetical protein